jgi:hypothetical protein
MRTLLSLLLLALFASAPAAADEPKKEPAKADKKSAPAKGDPGGTWTWTVSTPNGQSFESTATLKREGDKVSGTVSGRRGDTAISDGQYKDGTLTFTVMREREGRKMVSKFQGKVDGNAIKGTMTMDRGDGAQSRPWEAKRK